MKTIHPPATVGIFGSGQLGKMLCMAATRLGYKTLVYSDVVGCAFDVSPHIHARLITSQSCTSSQADVQSSLGNSKMCLSKRSRL
jgi:phosphoribosylaminoimidazole carboxylase (NCAIR synthetase)